MNFNEMVGVTKCPPIVVKTGYRTENNPKTLSVFLIHRRSCVCLFADRNTYTEKNFDAHINVDISHKSKHAENNC